MEIVIVGERENSDTKEIIDFINSRFIPGKVVILKTPNEECKISEIAAYTKGMEMKGGLTTVHICQNYNCRLPLNDMETIKDHIEALAHN